jgi:hypothetical protein
MYEYCCSMLCYVVTNSVMMLMYAGTCNYMLTSDEEKRSRHGDSE